MIDFSLSGQELKNLVSFLKEMERNYVLKIDSKSTEKLFELRNILFKLERKLLDYEKQS